MLQTAKSQNYVCSEGDANSGPKRASAENFMLFTSKMPDLVKADCDTMTDDEVRYFNDAKAQRNAMLAKKKAEDAYSLWKLVTSNGQRFVREQGVCNYMVRPIYWDLKTQVKCYNCQVSWTPRDGPWTPRKNRGPGAHCLAGIILDRFKKKLDQIQ